MSENENIEVEQPTFANRQKGEPMTDTERERVARKIKDASVMVLPSSQPTYTDAEIQKMQDLESAQIEKAYQLGYEEGKKDVQQEQKIGYWIPVHPLQADDEGAYLCSNCNTGDWDIKSTDKYCKFCGAKMQGVKKHDK